MTHSSIRVGFLSIGLMGSPLAGLLRSEANCQVLIPELLKRSKESQDRAEKYDLQGVEDLSSLFKDGRPQIEYFISVLPPAEASKLSQQVADLTSNPNEEIQVRRPIYVDLNAISPTTSVQISKNLASKGWGYVCGSIIGGPPRTDGFRPAIYLSGEEKIVEDFRKLAEKASWKVIVLENSGIGASKALKLSYSMLSKGIMALTATSMLAASSYSDSTSSALARELSLSQPGFLPFLSRQMQNVTTKSGRFVGEFEEMASYVDSGLSTDDDPSSSSVVDSTSNPSMFRPGDMLRSMAKMWGWLSKNEGKEERHGTLMEAQEMLKREMEKARKD